MILREHDIHPLLLDDQGLDLNIYQTKSYHKLAGIVTNIVVLSLGLHKILIMSRRRRLFGTLNRGICYDIAAAGSKVDDGRRDGLSLDAFRQLAVYWQQFATLLPVRISSGSRLIYPSLVSLVCYLPSRPFYMCSISLAR